MNMKQGVVLQQIIAKELIVADALADTCGQFNRGDLTTREKRILRDVKVCGVKHQRRFFCVTVYRKMARIKEKASSVRGRVSA